MKKIADFFSKWGFAMFLWMLGIGLLFSLGCCIYTSITNPFVGIVGVVADVIGIAIVGWFAYWDIKAYNPTNKIE